MNYQEWKYKRLQDVGTRFEHYSDIIALWEESIEMLSTPTVRYKRDEEKLQILKTSIELLRNTLDGMADYKDQQIVLRRLVDGIPRMVAEIEGGRGTPLNFGKSSFEEMG